MEMIKLEICGKTKTGSHDEIVTSGKDKGKVISVNDYNMATITVEVPKDIEDNAKFYGPGRYACLARNHEVVLLANAVRATLSDSHDKDQGEKNAIAQKAVATFPACLDPKPKTPGAARVNRKQKERANALDFMENEGVKKPYNRWSVQAREAFDRTYPIS